MRIPVAGKRAEITTGRECDLGRWNASAGCASGTKAATKPMNAYPDHLRVKVYEARRRLVEAGEPVTAVGIKTNGSASKSMMASFVD